MSIKILITRVTSPRSPTFYKTVPALLSLHLSLIFPFHVLPSSVHHTGFSICIFSYFLDIYILSSNKKTFVKLLVFFHQKALRLKPQCNACLQQPVAGTKSYMFKISMPGPVPTTDMQTLPLPLRSCHQHIKDAQ